MQINLIAVGIKMPGWVNDAFYEYAKRLPPDCRLNLLEIEAGKHHPKADLARTIQQEGELMLKAIPPNSRIIALDEHGQQFNTPALAKHFEKWRDTEKNVSLLIGGADGLSPMCLKSAHEQWSLSLLTLPHPMVRVIVAEQLYRAWSILSHHPYHRG